MLNEVPACSRASTCGMYCTRFIDRSSVSTNTMFGRVTGLAGNETDGADAEGADAGEVAERDDGVPDDADADAVEGADVDAADGAAEGADADAADGAAEGADDDPLPVQAVTIRLKPTTPERMHPSRLGWRGRIPGRCRR